jgi:predicted trehalose synthase
LLVAAALASCGGSDDKQATTAATSISTTTKAPPAPPAPDGHLSLAEYESLRAVLKRAGRIGRVRDATTGARVVRSACSSLKSGTRTELILSIRRQCAQLVRVLVIATRFTRQQRECEQAARVGDVSCFAQLYRVLAGTARVVAVRFEEGNMIVRKRHLSGLCARVMTNSKPEIDKYRSLSRHSRGAALALEAKDQARLQRALAAIRQDFVGNDSESISSTLRQLRTCRS